MKKKVLIADDDKAIIDVMTILLKEEGFSVIPEMEGENIVDKAIRHLPQLIILDILLSGEKCAVVVEKLRGNKSTRSIPILLASGNDKIEKISKEMGVEGFIAKPFAIDDFVEIVKRYI